MQKIISLIAKNRISILFWLFMVVLAALCLYAAWPFISYLYEARMAWREGQIFGSATPAFFLKGAGGIFAIIGTLLVIRRSLVAEKQLATSQEQLASSDYHAAITLLSEKDEASHRFAMEIFKSLIANRPNDYYIPILKLLAIFVCAQKETETTRQDAFDMMFWNPIKSGKDSLPQKYINLYAKADYKPNLQNLILKGANLSEAFLVNADLQKADLTKANLANANLTGSGLTIANLKDANLIKANLTETDLIAAKNLTQEQINQTYYHKGYKPPKLPDGLKLPRAIKIDKNRDSI